MSPFGEGGSGTLNPDEQHLGTDTTMREWARFLMENGEEWYVCSECGEIQGNSLKCINDHTTQEQLTQLTPDNEPGFKSQIRAF